MNRQTLRGRAVSGFTLIELLVVIAIIAILAAILFPIFAQARQTARGASSQSNLRQLSLSVLMYIQDYDELYPLNQRWGAPAPLTIGGTPFSMWTFDVAPYIKNTQIFGDPLAPNPIKAASSLWPYYSVYGYNYTVLSPYTGAFGTTPWVDAPANLSRIARPAEIVMLGGRFTVEEHGFQYYGAGTLVEAGTIEPPVCSPIPAWCFDDWAVGGNYNSIATEEAGHYTGGVSLRKQLNANFAFCDGHCKFMAAGQGAKGTNWFKGITDGNVNVTDPTTYMWQQSP
jgi:prepilin-type N-terminal cleavage/methylation domain-containing protein/prepilin-type processing-associated H-X9-DG protein